MATYSYASPLLSQVLNKGGIGLTEEDDPLEQITLALQIVRFHCDDCKSNTHILSDNSLFKPHSVANPSFPRKTAAQDLLHVIKQQPKLAKDASSALIDFGQSIQSSATPDDISTLLRATLQQEVYVRNSCLQALQVKSRHTQCVCNI